MPRWLQYLGAGFIALLLVGVPCVYARYRHHTLRNLHVVDDGILYRSGQLSPDRAAVAKNGRRSHVALHRRHDGDAERSDVATGRPVPHPQHEVIGCPISPG